MHGAASTQFSTIVHAVIEDISVHELLNEQLAELSTILDSFHQYHKCLHFMKLNNHNNDTFTLNYRLLFLHTLKDIVP